MRVFVKKNSEKMTAILLKKSSSFLYVFSAKMALKTVVFTLGFQYRIKKCDLDLALWSIPATLNRSPYHGFVLKNTIRAWRFDTFKMIIRTKNPRTPIESTIATRRVNIFGFYGGVGVRGVLPWGSHLGRHDYWPEVAKVAPSGASFGAGFENMVSFWYKKGEVQNPRERYTAIGVPKIANATLGL